MNMTEDDLAELMMSMSGKGLASYDSNLQKLGYVDFASRLLLTFIQRILKERNK